MFTSLYTFSVFFKIVIRMDYSLTLLQFLTSYVNGILGSSNHYTTLRMSKLSTLRQRWMLVPKLDSAELIMPMPCDPAPVLLGVCCREGKTPGSPKPCGQRCSYSLVWNCCNCWKLGTTQVLKVSRWPTIGYTSWNCWAKSWYTQQPEWISREMCWMTKVNLNRSHTMILFIWHSWNDKDEWMVAVGWGGDGRKGLWL